MKQTCSYPREAALMGRAKREVVSEPAELLTELVSGVRHTSQEIRQETTLLEKKED